MAVIINDFEIVSEPPTRGAADEGGSEGQSSAPMLRPEDIERILRHFEARRQRLLAD
jgi:hypothetical protein